MIPISHPTFIHNKYLIWYSSIIQRAALRVYDSNIHENHHVVPESMGGQEMVPLTYREHFICHLLLPKFTWGRDKAKMYFALRTFFYFDQRRKLGLRQRSRLYNLYKIAFKQAAADRREYWPGFHTKSDVFHIRHKGSLEEFSGTRFEIKNHTGMTAQQLNYLLANPGKTRHCLQWGIFDETVNMFSTDIPRIKHQPRPKLQCPHCQKWAVASNYNRWHGDNCSTIDPEGHAARSAGTKSLASIRAA